MSTIKIEFESEDKAVVNAVAALTFSLLGVRNEAKEAAKSVNEMAVVAEEVKAAPKRASRAKTPEPKQLEQEAEELETEELETEEFEAEQVTADDIRDMQAKKVAEHREAIKSKLSEFGATGISSLDEKHFPKYLDFLSKLK